MQGEREREEEGVTGGEMKRRFAERQKEVARENKSRETLLRVKRRARWRGRERDRKKWKGSE